MALLVSKNQCYSLDLTRKSFQLPVAQSHLQIAKKLLSFSACCLTMSRKRTSYLLSYFVVARSHQRKAVFFECQTKTRIRCQLTLSLYFDHRKLFENFLVWKGLTQSPQE